MFPVRPSVARLVILILAACLTTSAASAYESAANQAGRRARDARTLRGGTHGQARLPGDERTRRLASIAAELRGVPGPEVATALATPNPAHAFAPIAAVQSPDRTPARCRST